MAGIYRQGTGGKEIAEREKYAETEQFCLFLTLNSNETYFVITKFGLSNITEHIFCFPNSGNGDKLLKNGLG